MKHISYTNNEYRTPDGSAKLFAKLFPSFFFYTKLLANIFFSSRKARKGLYDDEAWLLSSLKVLRALEHTGLIVNISGIEHLQSLNSPCVIIANHMSMMETLVLPAIILPKTPVTFAIKESLLEYPVFKYIMQSRDPIAVSRSSPRRDLKTVINEGKKRLQQGMSVIIFPQTTRGTEFEPKQFNSIGVKLALKADVPVLPLALKTDAWTNGRRIKDLGRIKPENDVYFAFAPPLNIEDRGKKEHLQVVNFINANLCKWSKGREF